MVKNRDSHYERRCFAKVPECPQSVFAEDKTDQILRNPSVFKMFIALYFSPTFKYRLKLISFNLQDCDHKGDQPNLRVARSCSPKSSRERASSLGIKQASQNLTGTRIRSISEGEVLTTRTEKAALVTLEEPVVTPVPSKDALVVIDNSNVFIGAREAACAQNPKLRPRHIKVRLQALTQVLENGRNVTKRFACGSSPPANEHVWDVYR